MRGEEEKETGPAEKKMALLKKKNGSAKIALKCNDLVFTVQFLLTVVSFCCQDKGLCIKVFIFVPANVT